MRINFTNQPLVSFIVKSIVVQFCFTVVLAGSTWANEAVGQNLLERNATINKTNISLENALKKLEAETKVKFSFNSRMPELKEKVSINAKNQKLRSILKDILTPLNISYSQVSNRIVLKNDSPNKRIKKQNKPTVLLETEELLLVSGVVTDEKGEGIPGVSVAIKGTSKGTLTGIDGSYSIEISNNAETLVYSFVGYLSQEVLVGSQTEINIKLIPSLSNLDEIVVIGYGEQSRAKVVGAVGKLAAKDLNKLNAISVDQQLAGKMSGVVVNQSNGQPGESSQIIIRGTGTLTAGANPLIVVDGFPLTEGSSLNSINPNDIVDINVLKDAASAAIYGSRAANGVILVTTKQGSKNEKGSLNFDFYTGFQQQSSGVKYVDAYEFAQFLKEARDWGYVSKDPLNRSENDPNSVRVTKKIKGKSIDGRELSLDYLQPYLDGQPGLINTDWMNVAFRNAPLTNYALSYSGGNEKTKFYSSLGYFDQKGVLVGTGVARYSGSFSLSSQINKKIKIGFNIKPSVTNLNSLEQGSRSSGSLALLPLSFPFYSVYKEDGSLNISDQLVNEQRVLEGVRINGTPVENLLATATKVKDNKLRYKTFGNAYLNAELIDNLTYRLSLGGDYDAFVADYYYPSDVGSYRTPAPRSDANGVQRKNNIVNYLVENTLNYKFGKGSHNFDALIGHTFQKENYNSLEVKGTAYPDNNIQSIAGASSFIAESNVSIWTLESYLARLQYDFDAKYLFSAAIRKDGSSRFGVNNRWGNFPSLSAGWVMSRENFFPENGLLSFAKLSASWGQTGNNQIGAYGSQALVTSDNYINNNAIAAGYISSSAPNPDLGWEIASSYNIGLDLGFMHDKINLSMAYYKTNTKDLLLNVPVPQQTGYNTVLANIGEMENKGLEAQIIGNGFKVGSLSIGFNANLTTYKNKVIALGPGQSEIATGTDQAFVTKIGGSIAEIYGYVLDGIYKTQEEIDNSPHLSGTYTGDYRVKDLNNDGLIDDKDKISKGTFAPNLTYGFGANIGFKNFNFGFNFVGLAGRTILDGDMRSLSESGEGFAVPSRYYFQNRYHPVNNPNGFLGQPNFGNFSNSRKLLRTSTVAEKNNGDYIRLRDIRLSYDFPASVLQKIKLSGLNVYLSGNNVFTKTRFRGWNPDGTSSNILTSGSANGNNYPVAKSFTAGIRVTY